MKLKTSKFASNIARYPSIKLNVNDDEISNANTDKSLLGSTTSTSSEKIVRCCPTEKKNTCCCGLTCALIFGLTLTSIGIATIVFTPFDLLMNERLEMTPGLPPYELWKNPPDEVLLRMHIFNITNADEFLNGTATKLRVQEVGPIIYREKLIHTNVTFNANGTLTYTAKRTAIFLPEMNTIDLNATLVLPNLAVLGIPSYFWDAPFFTKFGVNLMIRRLNSQPIVTSTIYNYLWNFSDPILDIAQDLVPSKVPTKNLGLLARIYENFENQVTVFMGAKNGHENFFLIDKYDQSEYLPGYDSDNCEDKVKYSTEGVAYPQFLGKNTTVKYWRKTLCKVANLYYEHEVLKYGVKGYKYLLPNNSYDRTIPTYSDCYRSLPALPNGLSDVSKCYHDFPMAASFPHFLYGDDELKNNVDGLTPDAKKHESFVIIEPVTGIPLESRARSQSNLIVRKLTGFNERLHKFSDLVIPMFWAEYNQVGLPWYISALVYFQVNLLPPLQKVFSAFLVILGTFLLVIYAVRRRKSKQHLLVNKTLHFESETFLKNVN